MNSPEIKTVIVVSEDGSREEIKRGTVCWLDGGSGVKSVSVGLENGDRLEIVRHFMEDVAGSGTGGVIIVLNMLVEKMLADYWQQEMRDQDAGLQAGNNSQG